MAFKSIHECNHCQLNSSMNPSGHLVREHFDNVNVSVERKTRALGTKLSLQYYNARAHDTSE